MNPPFIVAELGASHCGSMRMALELVSEAKLAGADAIKVQTWDRMTVSTEPIKAGPWAGRSLQNLYDECKLPWDWHGPIFARARRLGMIPFSTPFDRASVDFLENLGCDRYKIASFEIVDLPLIDYAASKGKPLILSTGMASKEEIGEAVQAATTSGAGGVALLKCVSAYPADVGDYNLATMVDMAEDFDCQIGLSDHTKGSIAAVCATLIGATIIEKHITLDGSGPDGKFASTPEEFEAMVNAIRDTCATMGAVRYGPLPSEAPQYELRRSLWVTVDTKAGEELIYKVSALRPGGGLPPKDLPRVNLCRAACDISAGTPLTAEMLVNSQ